MTTAAAFVERGQLKMVLQVLIPMTVFVVLSIYIGIYISTFLFIGFFMIWHGRYPLYKTLPVAVLVPIAAFHHFRNLVPCAAAEGTVGALARLLRMAVQGGGTSRDERNDKQPGGPGTG